MLLFDYRSKRSWERRRRIHLSVSLFIWRSVIRKGCDEDDTLLKSRIESEPGSHLLLTVETKTRHFLFSLLIEDLCGKNLFSKILNVQKWKEDQSSIGSGITFLSFAMFFWKLFPSDPIYVWLLILFYHPKVQKDETKRKGNWLMS